MRDMAASSLVLPSSYLRTISLPCRPVSEDESRILQLPDLIHLLSILLLYRSDRTRRVTFMIRHDSSNPLSSPAMRLGAGPDRLDSWKEIANYLKREVRTVQLWEKKEGLPVHRHFHNSLGTVF